MSFPRVGGIELNIETVCLAVEASIESGDMQTFIIFMNFYMSQGFGIDAPINTLQMPATVVAVYNDKHQLLELLLQHGANPNIAYKQHYLIRTAVKRNQRELVEILLRYSVDVNICLKYAVLENNAELANIFLQHGANPLLDIGNGVTIAKLALIKNHAPMLTVMQQYLQLPLPEITLHDLKLILHDSCSGGKLSDVIQVGLFLQKVNLDYNIVLDDENGSPLVYAVLNEHIDIADYLLSNGARHDFGTISKDIPIELAVYNENKIIVSLLIKHGADIDAGVIAAIRYNRVEMLEHLLISGANPDKPDSTTRTPIERAVYLNNIEMKYIFFKLKG